MCRSDAGLSVERWQRNALVLGCGYGSLVNWWFRSPTLRDREQVIIDVAANWLRGRRSLGGRLTITDDRLLFTCNRLDNVFGGGDVAVDRSELTTVEVLPSGGRQVRDRGLGALLRSQLGVATATGRWAFVVSDVNALVDTLNSTTANPQTD